MIALESNSIKEWLRKVEDPELGVSIVDLGLIYDISLHPSGKVQINMTLTSPGCPMGEHIYNSVKNRLLEIPEIRDVNITLVWEPQWDPKTMATEECKELLGIW